MNWNVWLLKAMTGDRLELVASYSNRGHAVAKLRGLQRARPDARFAVLKG